MSPAPSSAAVDAPVDRLAAFDQHRPLLFSIAYRMLGSVMDAEDMVQETYLRWQQLDQQSAAVSSPRAYLSTIVTRLCIDHLRSARVQREQYVGPWLPEPLLTTAETPVDRLELADSLSLAFLLLLERLSPLERAVYLLREIFDYDYDEIARIVDRGEANCRQIVRRARGHLAAQRPRFEVPPVRQEQLLTQFVQTCARGDLDGLLELLTEDVVAMSDGGGKVSAARNPIRGRAKVSRFLVGLFSKAPPDLELRPAPINGQPAFVAALGGKPFAVLVAELAGVQICRVYIVVNPDKLTAVLRRLSPDGPGPA